MIFGTHPKQFNGYAKVMHEICSELSKYEHWSISVFGFQNFFDGAQHRTPLPATVDVYDAYANEVPKGSGFGFAQARDIVTLKRPDVVVIYNDMYVICKVLEAIAAIPDRWFKVIAYVDQVYASQKPEYIEFVNKHADVAMTFTPHWKECILAQGLALPCHVLRHGVNFNAHYPVPKDVARKYFNLPEDDFIIINLNLNQPRKRWDTCLKAFAQVIARQRMRKDTRRIRMIIGTHLRGCWDLVDIFRRELAKRDIPLEDGMQHVIIMDTPQRFTDHEINVLHCTADCGINTADGEGVGLCTLEGAAVGVPQIAPRLGGFIDYLDHECAIIVEPSMAYYVDNTRDLVGGEALMCDYNDYVDAIETYFTDEDLRRTHGARAREKITAVYKWADIVAGLVVDVLDPMFAAPVPEIPEAAPVPEIPEAAPVPEISEAAPVPEISEAAPVPEISEAAPVPEIPEAAPVPEIPEAAPVPEISEAVSDSCVKSGKRTRRRKRLEGGVHTLIDSLRKEIEELRRRVEHV